MPKKATSESRATAGRQSGSLKSWLIGFVVAACLLVLWTAFSSALSARVPVTEASKANEEPAELRPAKKPEQDHLLASPPDANARIPLSRSKSKLEVRSESPLTSGSLFLTIGGVIVSLLAVLFVLAKLMKKARFAPKARGALHLLDVLPLGPRRFVYLVTFRERTLLLGGSGDEVQLLAEYDAVPVAEVASTLPTAVAPERLAEVTPDEDVEEVAPKEEPTPTVPRITRPAARTGEIDGIENSLSQKLHAAAALLEKRRQATNANSNATQLKRPLPSTDDLKGLPDGARRVPPAFRHLLRDAVQEEAVA